MLKRSSSRNQRPKWVKVDIVFRMFLVLVIGFWMIYLLRLFVSHRLASENGGLVKEEAGSQQFKLGRRGLIMLDGENSETDVKKGISVKGKSNDKIETEQEIEDEDEIEQIEYLIDGVDRGGDEPDEGLEMEQLDDQLEENDDANRIESKSKEDDATKRVY